MTLFKHSLDSDPSRRSLFRAAALVLGGGALAGAGLSAAASAQLPKRTQKVVQYQTTPKGRSRCDNCSQWQPPASCKIVAGTIVAAGWCSAYAPKS